jgi:ubiquinol-cytochrome c reductase cytochrome b subunit
MMNWLLDLRGWVDARLPIMRAWNTHMGRYFAPKNFNIWFFFGVLSLLVLVNQLLTGIWLTMSYEPSAERAFASVEYIMRDVDYGWLIRYMHSTGASAFFAVVYLHMFRGLLYGSYRKPRELVWIFGMTIYLALMAEGFLGYVLPWGQMSYWGAQVIISLFGAIPTYGDAIVEWIRGDYLISGITLNRFFALHVVAIPIILLALVLLHILALHEVGSNNPDGIEIKKNKGPDGVPLDGVAFHPYYTVHDLVGVAVFLFVFCTIIFFAPEMGGYFLERPNFEVADSLKTPAHIAPVWYYTPFYSMLRAVPDKLGGFVTMGMAIAIMFVLPWLDRSPVKSIRYKGRLDVAMLLLFAGSFIILGVLGVKAPTEGRNLLARVAAILYFAFFLTMPVWSTKAPGLVGRIWLWLFGLVFVVFAFFNLDAGAFYGTEKDGSPISHPSLVLQAFTLLLGALFLSMPKLLTMDSFKPEPKRLTPTTLGLFPIIKGAIVVGLLAFIPLKAVGSDAEKSCGTIECDRFTPDPGNRASLQRGAKYYLNYCMGCHSLKYARYERTANDLGIPLELAQQYLIFDDGKIGDLMTNAMPPKQAKNWFGAAPPDLTLVTRARTSEWVYTYLRNFHRDDSPARPWGVNNRVFKDVAMPHAMLELQGLADCVPGPAAADHGEHDAGNPCASLNIASAGSMNAQEFDTAVADLVNFLSYIGEPMKQQRESLGKLVLLFIVIFSVFAYLLNNEYWKDVH